MLRTEIFARLHDVFLEVFDLDVNLEDATTADDVEGWDSVSHIRLILTVEKEFAVRFAAAEVGMLGNVGELVDLIAAKIGS
mgnify:CR=1 FL=1